MDSPWSGLCDVIDVDEHLLGNKCIHLCMLPCLSSLKSKYIQIYFGFSLGLGKLLIVCVCGLFVCFTVHKPEKLSWICVAGAIRDGVCAYTALHTHARMAAGHTLLVMDGASV